jgi:hypothetical protein
MKNLIHFAIFAIVCLAACRKSPTDPNSKQSTNLRDYADVTAPTVSNGTLTFTSKEHYNAWLQYLDGAIARDSTSNDTTSQDSLLHEIEAGLGCNSLRQKTYADFEALNETGWATTDLIPERHFIHDLPVLSTLNEYGEVKVGADIYSFFDRKHIVAIADPQVLTTVRNFKTSGYDFIEEIFQQAGVVMDGIEIDGVVQQGNVRIHYADDDFNGITAQKTSADDINIIPGSLTNDPCIARKVYLTNYYLYDDNWTDPNASVLYANYVVNWGDNTSSTYLNTKILKADHVYSTTGKKYITITATTNNNTYTINDEADPKNVCTNNQKSKTTWFYHGGGWAVRGHMEVVNNVLFHRINATSESFLWNGTTNVSKSCENLYVKANGPILHSDCSYRSNPSNSNSSKICKYISASCHIGNNYYWNSLTSDHAIYGHPNWYPTAQTMEYCE